MSAVDHLARIREERTAREKARIDKLRELNLKKYCKNEHVQNTQSQKLVKANSVSHIKSSVPFKSSNNGIKRPITAPVETTKSDMKTNSIEPKIEGKVDYLQKNIIALKNVESSKIDIKTNKSKPADKLVTNDKKLVTNDKKLVTIDKKLVTNDKKLVTFDKKPAAIDKKPTLTNKINNDKLFDRKPAITTDKILVEIKPFKKIDPKLTRKSMAASKPSTNMPGGRKSMIPTTSSRESVFDRLYKPKTAPKQTLDEVQKLKTDPDYLKKMIKTSGLILKRHTCFDTKEVTHPVRRSISAVHFKRVNKNEIGNCIHKWASIGDKLNKKHLPVDEGGSLKEEQIVSAIKSERKKVKFMTPIAQCNTPRPEDLQRRLKAWLLKRGKSLDAYQHLQCFGINHLPRKLEPTTPTQFEAYDEENKENIAVECDSDDGSYMDNMGERKDALSQGDSVDIDKWRQDSSMHTEFNDTADLNETTVTSADTYVNLDELLTATLNELTELLRDGFEWEQSVRYLRAIRSRFPAAPHTAAYWECRAALEERRGDLHASVHCWEQAIAKGTEHNVVDANLDTLLNKFMQLKISPNSGACKKPNPKMVDVKNVFKSTIIRFAVQQAKLRQSETPVVTVTPVRRSGRISLCPTPRVNKQSDLPSGNKSQSDMPNGNKSQNDMPYGNKAKNDMLHGNKSQNDMPHGNKSDMPHGNKSQNDMPNSNKSKGGFRQPLQIFETVQQVHKIAPQHVFTPNKNLVQTP